MAHVPLHRPLRIGTVTPHVARWNNTGNTGRRERRRFHDVGVHQAWKSRSRTLVFSSGALVNARNRRRARNGCRNGCATSAGTALPSGLQRRLQTIADPVVVAADGAVRPERQGAHHLKDLDEGSVEDLVLEVILPSQLQPMELLSLVRAAVRCLKVNGKLYFATTWGPNGPLRPLLALPDLSLEVCIWPPEVCIWPPEDGLWTYVCTHLAEAPPMPSAVQVVLEEGNDISPRPELSVWTTNPEEARFEYEEIYVRRCYVPKDVFLIQATLEHFVQSSRPKVVVDAGMNLGLFTRFAWEVFESSATSLTCLAFEPAPDVFQMAVRGCRESGLPVTVHRTPVETTGGLRLDRSEVHCFQLALSETSGLQSFTHFPASPANSALTQHAPEARWPEGQVPESVELQVTCCRLSDLLGDLQGAEIFLKVDVEGAEVDLLRGIDDQHWDAISVMAMEVSGKCLAEVLQLCKDHHLEVESFKQPSAEVQDLEELFMVYACRSGKKSWILDARGKQCRADDCSY